MAYQELINEMIATYRNLNLIFRSDDRQRDLAAAGLADDPGVEIQQRQNEPHLRSLMQEKRDHELKFSQWLKERVTGVSVSDALDEDAPTLGTESEGDPTEVLLSQFGTAREATLSLLRELDEQAWNATDASGSSIRSAIEGLIDNDHKLMTQVRAAVGGAASTTTGTVAASSVGATATTSADVPLDATISVEDSPEDGGSVTRTRIPS